MEREEVYKAIDSEREYQKRKWAKHNDSDNSIGDWILYIEKHLGQCKAQAYRDRVEALNELRKIAALTVAAGESLGMPERFDVTEFISKKQ